MILNFWWFLVLLQKYCQLNDWSKRKIQPLVSTNVFPLTHQSIFPGGSWAPTKANFIISSVCVHPFRQNPPLPASTRIILGPADSVWKHLQTAWSCQRKVLKQLGWGNLQSVGAASERTASFRPPAARSNWMVCYIACQHQENTWKQSASAWRLADCKFKSSFTKY